MDDDRNTVLNELLERLRRAINEAVVDSDEVNHCLAELHGYGWDVAMLLSASMLVRSDLPGVALEDEPRIRVEAEEARAEYLIDAADARWLAAIGISPTRHRSHPQRALPPFTEPLPSTRNDG